MMYAKCDGCGKMVEAENNGRDWFKPELWYERSPEGEHTLIQACSRECIELVEAKRKAENKQSSTLVRPI